jgi:hypothetical protein
LGVTGLEIVMTKPFVPILFDVVTSSVSVDPANSRLNFAVGAHSYSFAIDRTALLRLSRQIDGALQAIPPLPRKKKDVRG